MPMVAGPVPKATGIKAGHFQLLLAVLVLLTAAHVLRLADELMRPSPTETAFAPLSGRHETVRVGSYVLSIPVDVMARPHDGPGAGQQSTPAVANLAVIWPDLNPVAASEKLASVAHRKSLVTVHIHGNGAEPSSLQPGRVTGSGSGAEEQGPGGLIAIRGKETSDGKVSVSYREPGEQHGYLAVCTKDIGAEPALCARTIELRRGLSVTYRFSETLLPDWGRLDRRIRELIESFVANPQVPAAR